MVCTREQPYRNLQSVETAMAAMLSQARPTPNPYPYSYNPYNPYTPYPYPYP